MNKHFIKALVILIIMFFMAVDGFSNPVNEPCLEVSKVKIVVIGADADHEKNEKGEVFWIDRYREYLKSFNNDNEIINLTKDGLNSYQLVPTGSSSPYGRPKADTEYNISRAIGLKPDAIIVNLEYNDILENFEPSEQIVNLMLIASEANKNNVPIWINTPKPKTFDAPESNANHVEVKKLIQERFNPYVVKVWDVLANGKGAIKEELRTSDQNHINEKGQELIVSRLVAADIHQYCARRKYKGGKDISIYSLKILQNEGGGETEKFQVTVANSGGEIREEIFIGLDLVNQESNKKTTLNKSIKQGLEACTFESVSFSVDNLSRGDYKVTAYIAKRVDRNAENDTTHMMLKHMAYHKPSKTKKSKIQVDNKVELYAINIDGFSSHFNRFNREGNYTFSNNGGARVYQIQDIFEEKNSQSTIFKVVAEKVMEISAFEVAVENPGTKLVEVFYKRNIDEAKDNSLEFWSLASSQKIKIEKGQNQIEIPTKDIHLNRKDFVGFYIRTKDLSGVPISRNK